jgi:hypothetical protein
LKILAPVRADYDLIARSISRMGVPEDEVMPALGLLEGYVLGAAAHAEKADVRPSPSAPQTSEEIAP